MAGVMGGMVGSAVKRVVQGVVGSAVKPVAAARKAPAKAARKRSRTIGA